MARPKGKKYPEKVSLLITTEMREDIRKMGVKLGFVNETDAFRYAIQYFLNNHS